MSNTWWQVQRVLLLERSGGLEEELRPPRTRAMESGEPPRKKDEGYASSRKLEIRKTGEGNEKSKANTRLTASTPTPVSDTI